MRQNFIKKLSYLLLRSKASKKRIFLALFFLLALGGGLLYWKTAFGVTRTWDGGGGNANWNTAANWSGDIAVNGLLYHSYYLT